MALLKFRSPAASARASDGALEALLAGYSIEVMPRTAAKVVDFREILPERTRVYIAHIEGTPIDEMVQTARRLAESGFEVMPHFPARIIADKPMLADWIAQYQGEADVRQGLLLAGGVAAPVGNFDNSMQLLESGLFDKAGFERLHVAGHPEGNRDIDPAGGTKAVDEAVRWKQSFSERTDAKMALATQFAFAGAPVIAWANRLREAGIDLPIHLGIAGPAKLQTLIKFAIAWGVGPWLKVLKKRASDVSKLLLPYEPTDILHEIAAHRRAHPESLISQIHFFPLGGINSNARWVTEHGGKSGSPATSSKG